MADNIWLQGVAIVLPQVQQELNPVRVEFSTLALYAGLILGAYTWGILADLIGRRLSFNITLFLAGVFGIAAGGAPNFVAYASLVACVGFGVGGNLPVDGAVYLENIPQSHQWTLTLLSAWWAVGQVVASLISWGFIAHYSCPSVGQCPKSENMGWRYSFGTMTFLMFILRFVVFDLQESPKYLVAKGRDQEAYEVLQHIAKYNGKTIRLTLEELQAVGPSNVPRPSYWQLIKGSLAHLSISQIRPLFKGRKLALNTTLIIIIWGLLGLAYPLFNGFLTLYLSARVPAGSDSTSVTYRNYTIISVLGVPGSLIACAIVDYTRRAGKYSLGGRKFAMALSTALSGIFLFLFTTSKTNAAVLGYSCVTSLTENAMYGVLYAYTPEVFPAPQRGTGDALASGFNRITGILSPVIKIATTSATGAASSNAANGPIFVSAALFLVAAVLMLLLPIETAGHAAM
ncbi:major facilitator superfamily domain-containing protein [Amanita rubescens]|nr:major facilitator superfamily domain-containing protein [Amanita rubescens]